MIHLKLSYDRRRMKKDGTHPLVFRITYNGQSRDLATGLSCKPHEWDDKKRQLKTHTQELELMSKRLRDKELKLLGAIREIEFSHSSITGVQEVKSLLSSKKEKPSTILQFWHEEIGRQENSKKHGNARNYKSAMGGIVRHADLNIHFEKVTYTWLIDLEESMRSSGLKTNSISVYMRNLRSIFNKAINHGLVDVSAYPFRRYKIKKESTPPRSLSLEELIKFFNYQAEQGSKQELYWKIGCLIFLMRGINFADLIMLDDTNIKKDRIIYKRAKTGKIYSVKLLPRTTELLDNLRSNALLVGLLEPHELKRPEILPARISQLRKTCNKWLRRVGQELELDESLSTYVFRYSHANACKKLGYSKDLISESLGHGYGLSVSSAYLESYDIELIDEMNEHVCSVVLGA